MALAEHRSDGADMAGGPLLPAEPNKGDEFEPRGAAKAGGTASSGAYGDALLSGPVRQNELAATR